MLILQLSGDNFVFSVCLAEANGCHLYFLPFLFLAFFFVFFLGQVPSCTSWLPSSSMSLSPRGELTHAWYPVFTCGGLVFVAAAWGMPLDWLALAEEGAFIPWSDGAVTTEETVLGRLPLLGYCSTPPVFLKKRCNWVSRSFGLKGRLLV